VPLWGAIDPSAELRPELSSRELSRRRAATTDELLGRVFVPVLRRMLRGMRDENADPGGYGEVVHDLWRFFRRYDWATAWKSQPAWQAFVEETRRELDENRPGAGGSEPSMADLTGALRWMFNYMLPLNVQVPQVDLVHSTIAGFAGLAGVVAKLEHGTPFLLTEHGVWVRERYIAISTDPFTPFAKQFLMRLSTFVAKLNYYYADVVAPVANFNRRWELPYGVHEDKIQTIYNGIDPGLFRPRPKPAERLGRPVVIAAARVFPLKDVETMIRAAAVVRESLPDVLFLLYGSLDADLPYTARCQALVTELGLEQTFEFGGFHNRPSEVYSEGDLSVLSSISEGFPYTVLESMACERPVVATDVGGVREALEGFGVVVAPRDPAGLAAGLVQLLSDEDLRLTVGRQGRERVLAHFRVAQSIGQYRAVYQRLAGAQGEPGPG
ncbi:MAG TPA: GT4 family glycosyltransferase PelF, partial [Solirubrobacteraceae bacterium]|jgi:glycosyltransferase involved in cell wall biosynthesis|nr:GT4 family glycosyltransferase PelF [Solirubrobacteraceae bacterium]